jgi:pimeloyl-ACP methyl ester carboxylesterase
MNSIPGMPSIIRDQYDIDGIRVERFTTAPKEAARRPRLICVHGGCHASWTWHEHAAVYAAAGYDVHALNWRGRGGSEPLDDDVFVNMSIADVVDDIDTVARCFGMPPVLIGHSMGGLAAQLYASAHEVSALVLLTPGVPSNVGAIPIELRIGDMNSPWGPPPPDVARQMFFQGLDDMQAAHFNALLVPESPLRVYEATRWSLAVDATKLTAPILIVSGALDRLTPPKTGAALAALYGATYQLEPAHGHNVLLGEGARRIAADVTAWVDDRLALQGFVNSPQRSRKDSGLD